MNPLIVPRAQASGWKAWIRDAVAQYLSPLELWRRSADPFPQYIFVTDALEIFSFAAYGSMSTQTVPTTMPELGIGWNPITEYDTLGPARGITMETTGGTFVFDNQGVYDIALVGSFAHNSSNGGRTTNIRLWDVTNGAQAGVTVPIGIGRNVEDTSFALIFQVEITAALVGPSFRMEIGGGDSITNTDWSALSFSIRNIGEWRQPLPSDV